MHRNCPKIKTNLLEGQLAILRITPFISFYYLTNVNLKKYPIGIYFTKLTVLIMLLVLMYLFNDKNSIRLFFFNIKKR